MPANRLPIFLVFATALSLGLSAPGAAQPVGSPNIVTVDSPYIVNIEVRENPTAPNTCPPGYSKLWLSIFTDSEGEASRLAARSEAIGNDLQLYLRDKWGKYLDRDVCPQPVYFPFGGAAWPGSEVRRVDQTGSW